MISTAEDNPDGLAQIFFVKDLQGAKIGRHYNP